MSIRNMPVVTFNNGNKCPALGLGTWKSSPGDVTRAVKDAIDMGYRHIDTALVYENEDEVGEAVRDKIAEGVVKREDLFITSKVWNTYHKTDSVIRAIKKSLENLGLDYLDLYLIHWPIAYEEGGNFAPKRTDGKIAVTNTDYLDTWKGMERVLEMGLTKNIGISNFNSQQITRLLENCKITPVTNQIECHPYLAQTKLSEFCKSRGITITAYAPLGSPARPWRSPDEPVLLEDPKLMRIAKKYTKTAAQVLLRYQLDRGHITIPKSFSKTRLAENLNILDFQLTPSEIATINGFDMGKRFFGDTDYSSATSPFYPFNIPY